MSKKITGEAADEELEQLQELMDGNPEWKTIMENLQEIWNSKPADVDHDNKRQRTEDLYLAHINRLKQKMPGFKTKNELFDQEAEPGLSPDKKPFYKHWVIYAAAFVGIACFLLVYPYINSTGNTDKIRESSRVNEITVNRGAKTKIRLPDGTHVWVNADSKLSYPETFKGPLREVYLEGEGYFDVVKDAAHPFIVHTAGLDIRVLGTTFNVKAYEAESTIEATLIHGAIEVMEPNQTGVPLAILKPHEKLIFNKLAVARDNKKDNLNKSGNLNEEVLKVPAFTIDRIANNIVDSAIIETSWVYNRLTFEDEKFDNIAVSMERWFNVKIKINNDQIKSFRLTGSFVNETVEEALRELQYLVPFNFTRNGKDIEINKK